jgi:SAM-dependent methyltransferase
MLELEEQNALRERYREDNPGWQPATEVYAALVRRNITPASRILDLGCGRGGLVEQLESPRSRIVGLDPDIVSLAEHRLAGGDTPLPRVAAQNEQMPFRRSAFDVIFASWVLEHLSDPATSFRQIGQALKKGGFFAFITPNRRHPLVNLNQLVGRLANIQGALVSQLYGRDRSDTFPAYYRANTEGVLEELASDSGMRMSQFEAVADPSYLALKPSLFGVASRIESRLDKSRHIHLVGLLERI